MSEFRDKEAEIIVRRAAEVNKVTLPDKLFEKHDILEVEEKEKSTGNFFQLFTNPILCIRTIIIFFNW